MIIKEEDERPIEREAIQERIDDLIQQRNTFYQEAEARLAYFNGAIQELNTLLGKNSDESSEEKTE